MKKGHYYDKIAEKGTMRIDVMNKNSIVSLAMLFALWQTNRKDLLALIRPFILYSVGMTTETGDEIDISSICAYMEQEFGYKSFQPAVVSRVLSRETSLSKLSSDRVIEKNNKKFYLTGSLSSHIDSFNEKRTFCKAHSDSVTKALSDFLNLNHIYKRSNFTQQEAERLLLMFFEKQGGSILLSIEDFQQMTFRKNEIDYFIGKFILEQYENKTVLMDYLIELVKGYFVTTALYLQAENPDITKSAFKNVTFFLDTRLLLAYLGYKSKQENDSVQEMVRSLLKNGAKLACFDYNVDEVNNILEAYKLSRVCGTTRFSNITLEFFDEHRYGFTQVETEQALFQSKLERGKICSISFYDALEKYGVSSRAEHILDEKRIEEIVLSIKPRYNLSNLRDDVAAINTISRIRNGKHYIRIEKCRAVFVTSNTVLVMAIKSYCEENSIEYGFPISITDEDLCVIAWLKDFEKNSSLPQMRLLENVLAAITPSKELMDEYYHQLSVLEQQGQLGTNEATLLRVDMYARQELMELTRGEKSNLNCKTLEQIRQKMQEESINLGIERGKIEAERKQEERLRYQRSAACKQAEDEIAAIFQRIESYAILFVKLVSVIIAALFVGATIYSYRIQVSDEVKIAAIITTIITTTQAVIPFFGKDNFFAHKVKKFLEKKKISASDKRKEKYLLIINGSEQK